ncbi:MAG: AAA family ATPase [bacterium]|nr:AAA family ATPase [bacterium]
MHPGIQSWKILVTYAYNAFSIPLLLKTLFAPWQLDKAEGAHFDLLQKIVFAIFSRVLGFVARIVLIVCGLVFTLLVILAFPVFFIFPIKISREYLENLGSIGAPLSYGNTYNLNKHSMDLMTSGDFEIHGKEKALRMIERGLSKDTSHNVLVVGDTGVGKTSLISYLGRLGQSGLSFDGIHHHRVVTLNTEGFNMEDFDKILVEAEKARNVILVIENIHLYTTLFERLMPYLELPHLGIIVTTDFANYDQVVKAHPEFLSKFEKVDLLETNFDETLAILKNHAHLTRTYLEPDAFEEIVRLSSRFIGNQPQPMKSILILDELRALRRKISIEDVRQVVSDKTNMPIGAMSVDETKVLVELGDNMRKKIIGQDEAVKDVSEALKRLRTGISDPNKPAGSFLFLGPTGVGKTYTAKVLAESYFGRKNSMIRFDMSEFSLPESVIIFSDRLCSAIEEAPLSLVFFDELEKAHRGIHQLLLQVLDEGQLTRGSGRVANFKNAIIIATSNAGSQDIIGDPSISKKYLMDVIIKNNIFAPELLNRFSSIILFLPLTQKDVKRVSALLLSEFAERILADKNITLEITDALIDKVSTAGFDPNFGARPINRAIEEIVQNKVADFIIAGGKGDLKIM